jgi:hypothetical protein
MPDLIRLPPSAGAFPAETRQTPQWKSQVPYLSAIRTFAVSAQPGKLPLPRFLTEAKMPKKPCAAVSYHQKMNAPPMTGVGKIARPPRLLL